jgi:predicted GNAT family acetyltransferase
LIVLAIKNAVTRTNDKTATIHIFLTTLNTSINLEIRGQETENELTKFLMLELYIREDKQIIITNIFIPMIMRKKGFGMKILSIIFELAEKEDYALFISDMVQSFYNKMLQRNAIPINKETVRITNETKLF